MKRCSKLPGILFADWPCPSLHAGNMRPWNTGHPGKLLLGQIILIAGTTPPL